MFKKILPIFILLAAFTLVASSVNAQLKFKNATPCTIVVKAAAQNILTPCSGPFCVTGTVTIAPNSSVNLPISSCFTTAPGLGYTAVKVGVVGGGVGVADICSGPNPTFVQACPTAPTIGYTLQIFNPNEAGLF
ncbi:MAG: hypothetical protein AAGN35_03775 [Bacteroidota bacterium]